MSYLDFLAIDSHSLYDVFPIYILAQKTKYYNQKYFLRKFQRICYRER